MNKIISRKLATDAIDGIMTQLYHIALSGSAENAADQINFVTILQELVQLRHNDDYKTALEQMSMEGFTEYYTLFFDLVNAMGLESVKDLSDWRVVNTKTLPQAISQTKKTGDVVELLQGFNATELSPLPYDDKIGTVKRILNDWFVLDDKERQIIKLLDSVSSPEEQKALMDALLQGENSLLKKLLSKVDGPEKLMAFCFFDNLLSNNSGPKETITIPEYRTVEASFKKDKIKLTSYDFVSNPNGIKEKEYLVSPFATVMYTYKKERTPIPAFFFTDKNVLNDFIFENRYAETLDWATLTEKQKDDYYFEFVMHYLPQGFLDQLGSPLQLIVGAIIGIFAAGLLAPLKVALIALDIGSIGFDGYQGVLLVIEATERKKEAASIRELKESAHLMATGVSKLTMQVVNAILSFASSRKGGTIKDTTRSHKAPYGDTLLTDTGVKNAGVLQEVQKTSEFYHLFDDTDTATRVLNAVDDPKKVLDIEFEKITLRQYDRVAKQDINHVAKAFRSPTGVARSSEEMAVLVRNGVKPPKVVARVTIEGPARYQTLTNRELAWLMDPVEIEGLSNAEIMTRLGFEENYIQDLLAKPIAERGRFKVTLIEDPGTLRVPTWDMLQQETIALINTEDKQFIKDILQTLPELRTKTGGIDHSKLAKVFSQLEQTRVENISNLPDNLFDFRNILQQKFGNNALFSSRGFTITKDGSFGLREWVMEEPELGFDLGMMRSAGFKVRNFDLPWE